MGAVAFVETPKSIMNRLRHSARALVALAIFAPLPAQIATGHYLVLAARQPAGSRLLDVDPLSGSITPQRRFTLDGDAPLACTWDPVARHAIVAVATPLGSALLRVDPASAFERLIAILAQPVIALELTENADLYAVTGGPTGAIWHVARNGSTPARLIATPYATALGALKLSPIVWVAQTPPTGPPTISFLDPRLGTLLVPPLPLPALAGRSVTGLYDLPTGAPRQVLTDNTGAIHLLEFGTTLHTLAVSPPLPPGATADLQFETGATSLNAIVLGDVRHPYVHRVPVFGAPPTATRLAGPLAGDPVDFDRVESNAGWSFGTDCGGAFGSKTLLLPPGGAGVFEVRRAPASAPALAVFGLSDQQAGSIPLPAPLPGGCPLLVSPDVLVSTVADASGLARVAFPVPAALPRGLSVYAQWIVATPTGIGSTVGLSAQTEP